MHPKMNINETNYLDNTILSLVSATNHTNLLNKIIKVQNINTNIQNYEGMTSFFAAIINNLWNNAKILLNVGANPEIVDAQGKMAHNYLNNRQLFIYNKIVKEHNSIKDEFPKQPEIIKKGGWLF
jgi:hypothetical protein